MIKRIGKEYPINYFSEIQLGVVPSKIYPGYPGDIPDIFFDFFNKNFSENISEVSGVKVSKCLKNFWWFISFVISQKLKFYRIYQIFQ